MYKIFTFIFLIILFFGLAKNVQAQVCASWCDCHCDDTRSPGCYSICSCCDGVNVDPGNANPGFYVCNRPGGQCPIGNNPPTGDESTVEGPLCTETVPTNLSTTRTSDTSAILNWTPGTPAGPAPYQALWVSTNPDPYTGCAGSAGGTSVCPVRLDADTNPLGTDISTYTITNLLTPGTVYYWQIMNYMEGGCYLSATSPAYLSSCGLSSSAITLAVGNHRTVTSSIASGTGIQRVTFASNPSYVSVGTASDTTYPYQTQITGVATTNGGTVNLVSNAYVTGGTLACTSTSTVNVTPPLPWWQVKDSDVSSNGDLTTNVPDSKYFDLDGTGQFPGIPSASGATDIDGTNVSNTGWFVDSAQTNAKVYDHTYFTNQIPKDTVITTIPSATIDGSIFESGGTLSYGYYWYKYDGTASGLDLTITAPVNVGSRKIILLVDSANLNINGSINLTDGQGFFMTSVGKSGTGAKGNIVVDPAVGSTAYDLEGIYQADGTFDTGLSTLPLSIRGSVVGYDGIIMDRDLGDAVNGTTPAEFYEYAPDQIMLYPSRLGSRKINWKEVAP